jgi:hypothetical protein
MQWPSERPAHAWHATCTTQAACVRPLLNGKVRHLYDCAAVLVLLQALLAVQLGLLMQMCGGSGCSRYMTPGRTGCTHATGTSLQVCVLLKTAHLCE